jgi:hypothetical protein
LERGGKVHISVFKGDVVFVDEDFHVASAVFTTAALSVSAPITAVSYESGVTVKGFCVGFNVFFPQCVDVEVSSITDFTEGEEVVGMVGAFVEVAVDHCRVEVAKIP